MALSYDEAATLMNDIPFRGRIKVAILNYAKYIAGEDPGATAHNSRYKWAQNAYQQPDAIAMQIQPPTVMTDQVQNAGGAAVLDGDLQMAVESVINKLI